MSDQHLETIFNAALKIMNEDSALNHYLSRIYNIFMLGIVFHPTLTVKYLQAKNIFEASIKTIMERSAYFQTSYDRKCMICGLINLLNEKVKSGQFDELAQQCVEFIAYNLKVQQFEELKKNRKTLKGNFSDEQNEIELFEFISAELKKLAGIPDSDDLDDDDLDMDMDDDDDDDDDEDEAQNILKYLINEKNHVTIPLSELVTKLDNEDEFKLYAKVMNDARVRIKSRKGIRVNFEFDHFQFLLIFFPFIDVFRSNSARIIFWVTLTGSTSVKPV